MVNNKLKLNGDKTDLLVINARHRPCPLIDHIDVSNFKIKPSDTASNIGVTFDRHMSLDQHVTNICKTCFFHLRKIAKIRDYLSTADTETLVHSLITSKLDSCNSLLYGLPKSVVDDVTISEGLLRNGEPSVIQSDLTSIATWASNNLMKLNAKKCKEMQICFFRSKPELPHLCVEDQILECVPSHKVLGLIIQDDLKWNEHISMIVTKASKRLHILRVLRRGGIPPHDLITIYYALIRSTLEYCCTVWHCGLPMYLSEQVEKIQKRALRIILPGRSYGEAQEMLQCPRLDIRRGELCEKTMKNIALGSRLSSHLTLTSENEHVYNLRNFKQFASFKCRTDRFGNSFFPSMISVLNK